MKKLDFDHMATKQDISELKQNMLELKVTLFKWMVGLLFLQAGFIITVMRLSN